MSLTEDEAAELERLEAEFDAEGGRGVGLADRIDDLRRKRDEQPQTWRVEVRYDFTGTRSEVIANAHRTAAQVADGAEVTSIMDENWDDIDAEEALDELHSLQ